MKPDPKEEAGRWLTQAEHDCADARLLAENRRYHLACYLAQQCAEKSLKAVLYGAGELTVLGHSAADLAKRTAARVPSLAALVSRAALLDKFYVPTR